MVRMTMTKQIKIGRMLTKLWLLHLNMAKLRIHEQILLTMRMLTKFLFFMIMLRRIQMLILPSLKLKVLHFWLQSSFILHCKIDD